MHLHAINPANYIISRRISISILISKQEKKTNILSKNLFVHSSIYIIEKNKFSISIVRIFFLNVEVV